MAGLRAPFTLTGCAALMAAVYGAVRLPETMGTRKSETTGAFNVSSKEETTVRELCRRHSSASMYAELGSLLSQRLQLGD